jgi:ATP-dependent DNA ligase
MVGGAASFTVKDRSRLLAELEPLRKGVDVVHDGEPSRWNSAADKRWIPIRPEKVAEVAYDQMEGNAGWQRFRHTVRFVRWRPDRDPASCTFDQLDVPLNYDLYDVLETR